MRTKETSYTDLHFMAIDIEKILSDELSEITIANIPQDKYKEKYEEYSSNPLHSILKQIKSEMAEKVLKYPR